MAEARRCLQTRKAYARLNKLPVPYRVRLYGEAEYQAKSWKGLDTRVIYKAVLHHEMRTTVLQDTELQKAQPSTVIATLFKIAVKVVEYKDRVKLYTCQAATR